MLSPSSSEFRSFLSPGLPGDRTAAVVLFVAPILAFRSLGLPGIFSLLMAVPAIYLAVAFARRPGVSASVWQVGFLAVVALSVLWGDDPAFSGEQLRTFLPLGISVVLAGGIASAPRIRHCITASFVVILGSSVVVLLLAPSTRSEGDLGAWSAQYDKNVYGCLLVFGLAIVLTQHRVRYWLTLVPPLLFLIGMNRSVTAWVIASALLISIPIARCAVRRLGSRAAMPVLGLGGVFSLGLGYLIFREISDRFFSLVEKDPSLSARTDIWIAVWPHILERPWLGHGAFTFLNPYSDSPVTREVWLEFTKYLPPHAHNGILDLWGQVGLLGVVVLAGMILHASAAGISGLRRHSRSAGTALALLVVLLAFSITEPTFLGQWFVMLSVIVSMAEAGAREPGRAMVAGRGERREMLVSA